MNGKLFYKWGLSIGVTAILIILAWAISSTLAQGPSPEGSMQLQGNVSTQALMGTAFTYQGQLRKDGNPVNGTCDFQFSLWDAATGGAQIGSTQTKTGVNVSNGFFTVQLNFGAGAFQGDARWLQIAVCCPAGSGSYTTLSPRQPLTPAPYALALPGLWTQQNAFSPNIIGGYSGNSVSSGVMGATIGGGGSSGYPNRVTNDYGTVGGGYSNTAGPGATVSGGGLNSASGKLATVGGGAENIAAGAGAVVGGGGYREPDTPSYAGNQALATASTIGGGFGNVISNTGSYATIGGGIYNTASGSAATVGGGESNTANGRWATVGGGRGNTANGYIATVGGGEANTASNNWATVSGGVNNTASSDYATIGGGVGNIASALYTTIGGGGANTASGVYATINGGSRNTASGVDATIGGGYWNSASGSAATIGGGWYNTASGYAATVGGGDNNTASGWYATVGGGYVNNASGYAATVGGGGLNTASGHNATVGGGYANDARGYAATVPGGYYNTAQGAYSFAAGRRAKAYNNGCFVWGDSTDADVACNNNDRWVARASGGVYFYTNPNLTTGSYLAAGGSSWNAVSNRDLKENFRPVDTRALLERLAAIPITTWNYKSQDPSIRHIGPMAEDFNALVEGLGGEGKDYINSLDADGVSLAAIQGLYGLVQEKDARIAELEKRVTALEAQNAAQQAQIDNLEARLAALEQRVGGSAPAQASALPVYGLALGGLAIIGAVVYRRREGGRR